MENRAINPASFRDPSGCVFYRSGEIYRQVNNVYKDNYDCLVNSGLYKKLIDDNLLIAHEEVDIKGPQPEKQYKVIKPEKIFFTAYPYEWCFSQLKAAAIATLEIQAIAFDYGMILKDCSSYNIQFRRGRPVLIDTTSFEKYKPGEPWIAYRQYCQHFLSPLALMSYKDIRLNQLLRIYLDGLPLDLTSSLLPNGTRFMFSLLTHIHLHSKAQEKFANKQKSKLKVSMNRISFLGLVDSLLSTTRKLDLRTTKTEWGDYYHQTNYSEISFEQKKQVVSDLLDKINVKVVWDLGANTGVFSRCAAKKDLEVISFDIDPLAVERNYAQCIINNETNILPLFVDLTNPSPGIGWENKERMSLIERGPADAVLALALIHHLAISNNLPFKKIAEFFYKICDSLIIEFIPKEDSQVQKLLSTREDIFLDYDQNNFENEFRKLFKIESSCKIKDSHRTIYLMKKH